MKLKLIEKRDEAKGTKSFFWQPERQIKYLPGQYFYFTLPILKYPDPRGATRHFTISASPTEGDILRNTTRIRPDSGYKRTLENLKIGEEIEGDGPNGTFILDENEKEQKHIFFAGGIGITPFRSFLKYNIDKDLEIPMHLIYSNSAPDEIVFRNELEGWASENLHIKVDMTITKPEEFMPKLAGKEKWKGLAGRIDENLLKKLLTRPDLHKAIFWLCGPPTMVDAMEKVLGKLKITSDRIRSEKFTGY